MQKSLLMLLAALALMLWCTSNASTQDPFQHFLAQIRHLALARGITQSTLNKYLSGLETPQAFTIMRLQHQAQKKLSFEIYFKRLVPKRRVNQARSLIKEHHALLQRITQRYHVAPQYIVALWGIESDFGHNMGHARLIPSLVTLAYQHHRQQFFRRQLLAALTMLNQPHIIVQQTKSSWAGGMGQPQFMPLSYQQYAIDFDHDGFKNIWTSIPDTLASIAYFLQQNGWHANQPWGIAVKLTKPVAQDLIGLNHQLTQQQWHKLGVISVANPKNITPEQKASLIQLDKQHHFLVFHNFRVLLLWNNTFFEAATVGLFANHINSTT